MVLQCAAVLAASLHVAALLGPVLDRHDRHGLQPRYLGQGHGHAPFDHPPSKLHPVKPVKMFF
jgi:hypothetical protein